MHPPAGRRSESRPPPRNGDPTTRLEAGDARTLAALYDRHAGAMYSLAMRITGEPDAAVAIVRAVFAAAWSEAARHPGRHAPDVHWLLSTTRVRAIDDVRARGAAGEAAPSGVETAGDEASAGTQARDVATLYPPDPAQGQVADEDDSEDTPRLRATFRGLPVLERLAIELAYFEGLTITQIAARLEQPPRTVNLRIRNGLQRFAGRPDTLPASEPQNGMPPTGDLAGLYALGALNASERAAFDAHLEVHRESVDEVLSLLPVTRRLALTAPPHELPSGLRDRVIETVTGARLPRAAEGEAPESSPSADTDAQPDPAAQDGQESVNEGDGTELASAGGRSELGAEAGSPEPVDVNVDAEPADEGDSAEPAEPGGVPGASDADENAEVVGGEPDPTVDQATEPVPTPPHQEPTSPMQQPTPAMQEAAANERQPTPTTQKTGRSLGRVARRGKSRRCRGPGSRRSPADEPCHRAAGEPGCRQYPGPNRGTGDGGRAADRRRTPGRGPRPDGRRRADDRPGRPTARSGLAGASVLECERGRPVHGHRPAAGASGSGLPALAHPRGNALARGTVVRRPRRSRDGRRHTARRGLRSQCPRRSRSNPRTAPNPPAETSTFSAAPD